MTDSSGQGAALRWAALMAGIVFAWSGFHGQQPWTQIRAVLSGAPLPRAGTSGQAPALTPAEQAAALRPLPAAVPSSTTKAPTSPCCGGAAVALVSIPNHPGFRLQAPAAASLARVEASIGRPVKLTGSYRTCAAQTAANAANSERFAKPCDSMHPRGLAVDIDNKPGSDLIAAMTTEGWHRARASDEPWHWSYGVTG